MTKNNDLGDIIKRLQDAHANVVKAQEELDRAVQAFNESRDRSVSAVAEFGGELFVPVERKNTSENNAEITDNSEVTDDPEEVEETPVSVEEDVTTDSPDEENEAEEVEEKPAHRKRRTSRKPIPEVEAQEHEKTAPVIDVVSDEETNETIEEGLGLVFDSDKAEDDAKSYKDPAEYSDPDLDEIPF